MYGPAKNGVHIVCCRLRVTVHHRQLFAESFPASSRRHGPLVSIVSSLSVGLLPPTSEHRRGAATSTPSALRTCPVRFLDLTKRVTMATLETLRFDNKALRVLPIDEERRNFTRQVSGACFSRVEPTLVKNPHTVAYSLPAMELLDLGPEELQRPDFCEYLSGNRGLPGTEPAAHCYCGHQFGVFAGQLGDGATMYLGEVINKKGERWEVQFKGAGLTPFSRTADGRKVLRSSIREFLCSEAMFHLGVPTTRAASCVTSDTRVVRDIFYTGDPIQERATVILRVAETFIRFGSFEICKPTDPMSGQKGPSVGNCDIIQRLLDYTVETFYPQIWEDNADNKKAAYLDFYRELVKRTAHLVAEWQCVGWCHGVLNTDNMSIVGLTIDYGPYGFMDRFDRGYICNGSDNQGRYAFDQQPEVCKWNLGKLAEQLAHLIPPQDARSVLDEYEQLYTAHYMAKMRKKMGLLAKEMPTDSDLVEDFLLMLEETGADMTNSFRLLSRIPLPGVGMGTFSEVTTEVTEDFLSQCCTVGELREANKPRMDPRQIQMFLMLSEMNPDLAQQLGAGAAVITKELKRVERFGELKDLTADKKRADDVEKWRSWLLKYEARLQLEVGVAGDLQVTNSRRVAVMNANNPRFILRNYIAQNAIEAAEKGDFSEVRRVLRLLETPYSDEVDLGNLWLTTPGSASTSSTDESAATAFPENKHGADAPGSCAGLAYDSKPPLSSVDLKVT